jgi:RNA polymerase sigma-70 factor (ECF subfamily)
MGRTMNELELQNDEELMELYKEGDYKAFKILYKRHNKKVYQYLKKKLHEDFAVEEVFQMTFIKLHKCRQNYDPHYLFTKWLYTICRSECFDYWKRRKIDTSPLNEDLISDNQVEKNIFGTEILDTLAPSEKLALEMRYLQDAEYDEIAAALLIKQPNARKIVSRAIAKLRQGTFSKKASK